MNKVLQAILATNKVYTDTGECRALHSQIDEDEGRFLQALIRKHRPAASLEVGCAYGISSLFICEALKDVTAKSHIIIDPYQIGSSHVGPDSGYEGIGLLNLKRAGLDSFVTFRAELSYRALPILEAEGQRLDFAFIDGMHTFDYTFTDFFYIDKMLKPGGLVVFDDLTYPSVQKVCRYVLTNLPYSAIGPAPIRDSLKRRAVSWIGRRYGKPEMTVPNYQLGIPEARYIALRKSAEDVLGDGTSGTRRWDFHAEF